jgi:hypothetical protein
MQVALLTAQILALFTLVGYPASRLCFDRLDRWRLGAVTPPASWLLAPLMGLAVFAVYTGCFFAARRPVAAGFPGFWVLVAALWLGFLFLRFRKTRIFFHSARRPFPWLAGLSLAAGAIAVAAFGLLPFFKNPALIFWHYAGSDGYMYMRIAEHIAEQGSGVMPELGPYHGASGFLAEVIHNYQIAGFQDKPAVMSTLGGLAVLFNRTTIELFSPLSCAALVLLCSSLFFLGRVLLRLPAWAAAVFAFFACCCPAIWMLYTHTFFGNILALPFYVALLALIRPFPAWGTAIGAGFLFGAQMALFPDGTLALLGMFAAATPYLAWTAWRRRRLLRLFCASGLAVGATSLVIFMFGLRLWVTATGRLNAMGAGTSAGAGGFKPLETLNWIWGALNLNYIPPEPLRPAERPYLFMLAALLVAFVAANLWRRRASQLVWYLAGFGALLALGCAGVFKSDYELFRGLAVFSYLPIAAVCGLPWLLAPARAGWRRAAVLAAGILLVAPLLQHYLRVDWRQFRHGLDNHPGDAQYTAKNLQDRAAMVRIARQGPLMAGSEIPSFTAIANTMVLFSQVPLGIPSCFHKFTFFRKEPNDDACAAPFLVRNLQFTDVTETTQIETKLYASESYEVVPNDLNPFYDNDTFPQLYGITVDALRTYNFPVVRTYSQATRIAFNNTRERPVSMILQVVGAGELPPALSFAFDDGPFQEAPIDPAGGMITLTSPVLAPGVHHIRLAAPTQPLQVMTVWLREAGLRADEPWQRMHDAARRVRPTETNIFRYFSPMPSKVFSQYGAALYGESVGLHPLSAVYFRPPAGNRRIQTSLTINPEAYENLPAGQATDGVELVIAVLTAEGGRTIVHSRLVNPLEVTADRGPVPVDVSLDVPSNAEIEISIGPGPHGNGARDWASLGPLTIK